MAILAGIDEAGLGPVLGPLVVTGTAFRVPDDALDRSLWQTLRATCTSKPSRTDRRLAIADSKKLYKPKGGLGPLERAALVMSAVRGDAPKTWRGLLDDIAPGATGQLDQYAWYCDEDLALPLGHDVGDVSTRATAIRRDCAAHGIEFLGASSEPLPEGHYNRLVSNTRNKAVVLLGLVMRVIDRILKASPDERVRVCVDRLGGRTHYRETLSLSLAGFDMQVLEESDTRSAYRLTRSSRTCEIEFLTGGESRHFAIALASVYSKYVRELYMHAFNRYWCGRIDGLRRTAGYYTDAHRWLRDAGPRLDELAVDRRLLVRER